jgi:hypothetical protein
MEGGVQIGGLIGANSGELMKAICGAVVAVFCLTADVQAAAIQACNVTVDIIDNDPKGTHVRETPGGRVIATLPTLINDDWIEVHVLGQSDDWFLIDSARQIGDNERVLFRGKGYLHRSMLGSEGFLNGTVIWTDHDARSRVLDPHADGDQSVDFLGCWGDFVKVHMKKGTGWTQGLCLNQRTTCP